MYHIQDGDYLEVIARHKSIKELKEEEELNRLKASYPRAAQGTILYKNKKAAELNEVIFRIHKFKGGALAPGDSFENLPEKEVIHGIILEGIFIPNVYGERYNKLYGLDPYFRKRLTGTEEMKLTSLDGEELLLTNIRFYTEVIKKGDIILNKVEFHGDLKENK